MVDVVGVELFPRHKVLKEIYRKRAMCKLKETCQAWIDPKQIGNCFLRRRPLFDTIKNLIYFRKPDE